MEQHFQSKSTTQRSMSVCVIFQTLSVFKGFCRFWTLSALKVILLFHIPVSGWKRKCGLWWWEVCMWCFYVMVEIWPLMVGSLLCAVGTTRQGELLASDLRPINFLFAQFLFVFVCVCMHLFVFVFAQLERHSERDSCWYTSYLSFFSTGTIFG